jgi:hypothetical protein
MLVTQKLDGKLVTRSPGLTALFSHFNSVSQGGQFRQANDLNLLRSPAVKLLRTSYHALFCVSPLERLLYGLDRAQQHQETMSSCKVNS